MRTCIICGAGIDHLRRDAKTCSDACRQAAHRRGLSAAPPAPRIEPTSVPTRQRKPSVDDLARLILTLTGLEASFRFASERAEFRLRPLCRHIADSLAEIMDREGLR